MKDKPVGNHFSNTDHNGITDIQISVLEFIKKAPESEQAANIRKRVERNWTHTLRTLAPFGLNLENPKEYSKRK